jgi:hypothetical protein
VKIRGYSRLFLALPLAALALPLAAATPELDPLAGEVAAYLAAGAQDPATSLMLSLRVGWSEKSASFEKDEAKKAELLGRLEGLRRELTDAGSRAVLKASGSAIEANGAISGRVTDDGEPLSDANVAIYQLSGNYIDTVATGPDGRYSISLPPGTYVAYAQPPFYRRELSPQLFDGKSCYLGSTCQPSDGTPLTIASGGHRAADFALADLGGIAGTVRRRDTQEPVSTQILVYEEQFSFTASAYSDAEGNYSLGGLEPGNYWVVAEGRGELTGMIYDDVPCNARPYSYQMHCTLGSATWVVVGLDQVTPGIDFGLYRGATLAGRVVDAQTGQRPNFGTDVNIYDASYNRVASSFSLGDDGSYLVEGLAGGTYYVGAESYELTSQFYDGVDCIPGIHCLAAARPLPLILGGAVSGIDFALRKRGTLTGRVRDRVTGAGIENAEVVVWDVGSGYVFANQRTDSAGFFSISGIPAVGMRLRVEHGGYLGEWYDNVDVRLGPATAKAIAILPAEVVTLADIELDPRGSLAVRALAAESGDPLICFDGMLLALDGSYVGGRQSCDPEGRLQLDDLLPGSYYFMVRDYSRANYLYGKGTCNLLPDQFFCNLAEGARVEVRSGQTTDLGTVSLERRTGFRVLATFGSVPPGSPPPRARLRLFEADGDEVNSQPIGADYSDWSFDGLAPGSYRLVVDGSPNWESFAYPGAPCSRWYCDPQRGAAILLAAGQRGEDLAVELSPIAAYTGCTASDAALCLNQGRYRVTATWRDFAGSTGAGVARGLTADSGYFYFFSPNNIEVLVKTLNGCDRRLGHHFWFYGAGLTNVQVELRVVDTLTGAFEIYTNLLGQTFQPILDNQAFATCDAVLPTTAAPQAGAPGTVAAPPTAAPEVENAAEGIEYCQDGYSTLCLGGRFEVRADYRTFNGNTGSGSGNLITPDTAIFYFFDPSNIELVVKILDACSSGLPGYWVFASGLTDVAVDLTITDKATNRSKIYRNELEPYKPVLDLGSFPCN